MSGLLEKISNKMHTSEKIETAPVVKERIHEHAEHIDKTHVQEAHEKVNVVQTVQPIVDEQREALKTRVEDHGTEVHEHGRGGLDSKTEAELEARRAKVAATGGVTVDRSETQTSQRPDVDVTSRTHTIEQVIPVAEVDIYKPEVIEHHKKEIEIVHDRPELQGTKIAHAISRQEWEAKGGHIGTSHDSSRGLERAPSSDASLMDKLRGKGGDASSSSSSSSSSSEDESGHRYTNDERSQRRGLRHERHQKLSPEDRLKRKLERRQRREKWTPEQKAAREQRRANRHKTGGTSSYDQTSSHGYAQSSTTGVPEKKSLGQKIKDVVPCI